MTNDDVLQVVDPHIHLWDVSAGLYHLRENGPKTASTGDYLLEDLMADAGPVRILKAVHVEAFPKNGLAEAQHVQAIADSNPAGIAQGIVAYADLSAPDVDEALSALTALPNVRSIRQALNVWVPRPETIERDLLNDPHWRKGYARLAAHDLAFDLQVRPEQLQAAAELVAEHPEVRVVLNHLGCFANRSFANWKVWRDGLRALAAHPNVFIKISGPAMYDKSPSVESVRPYVFEALDAFGVNRAMFASNFPVDKRNIGYAELWAIFAETVKDLTSDERAALTRTNAERFYRI